MVDLKPKNVIIGKDKSRVNHWNKIFQKNLENNALNQKYTLIIEKTMVGLYIVMFVKENLKHNITFLKKV